MASHRAEPGKKKKRRLEEEDNNWCVARSVEESILMTVLSCKGG